MKTLIAIALFAVPVLLSIAVFTHHMTVGALGFWVVTLMVVCTVRRWTAVGGV